jgi:copper chaperone
MELAFLPVALADSCINDPTTASCATYVYPRANADLDVLCTGMGAGMAGCEVRSACASNVDHFCQPFSVLSDVCAGPMSGMSGCANYTSICRAGTSVLQCAAAGPIPKIVDDAAAQAFGVCGKMSSTAGCATCTSASLCPGALSVLHAGCDVMPSMGECDSLRSMCTAVVATSPAGSDGYGGLASLCGGIVAPFSAENAAPFCIGSTIMYMKGMDWNFADGVCITFVYKGWVLNTPAKYWFSLLLAFTIGLLSQILQCVRGRFRKGMMRASRVTRARTRRAIGRKFAALTNSRRSDTGLLDASTSGDDALASLTLTIEGMTCGGCASGVEGALTGLSGVRSASAAWEEGTVTVRFDAALVPATALLGAVEAVGYGAALPSSASTSSSSRPSSRSALVAPRRGRARGRLRSGCAEALPIVAAESLSSLLFALQLAVGYFLMLLIMSYHAPLALVVVLGIASGHLGVTLFETYAASPATSLAASLDGGGAEPCCETTIDGDGGDLVELRDSLL